MRNYRIRLLPQVFGVHVISLTPGPVHSTRGSGFASGSRLSVPSSSWPASFPQSIPLGLPPHCSPTSQVLLPSDSSGETTTGVWLLTFPVAPDVAASVPRRFLSEVSRFSREECPHMPGSLTPPERDTTRLSRCPVLPSHQVTSSASGIRCFRSSIARLCFPLSTLPHALAGRRGMTRGQCDSLRLHCKTLSFSTLHRF